MSRSGKIAVAIVLPSAKWVCIFRKDLRKNWRLVPTNRRWRASATPIGIGHRGRLDCLPCLAEVDTVLPARLVTELSLAQPAHLKDCMRPRREARRIVAAFHGCLPCTFSEPEKAICFCRAFQVKPVNRLTGNGRLALYPDRRRCQSCMPLLSIRSARASWQR
jgi:hypothetical protein